MAETSPDQPTPEQHDKNWFWSLLWLLLGLVPSILALKMSMTQTTFLLLNAICSLLVGICLWRGFTKSKALRGVLGLGVGGLLFHLNLSFFAILSAGLFLFNYVVSFSHGCCSSPP